MSGAQCVMTSGMLLMLKWSADSWDSLLQVRIIHIVYCISYWCFAYLIAQCSGAAVRTSLLSSGTGPIWLDDVQCVGTETRLIDCRANREHNCLHTEDAGVICQRGMSELVVACGISLLFVEINP